MSILRDKDEADKSTTLGRAALTGVGTAILARDQGALLGGGILDYSLRGKEQYSVLTIMIVFNDFSSIVIHGKESEFRRFMSYVPPEVLADERTEQAAEQVAQIERISKDGRPVLRELNNRLVELQNRIASCDEELKHAATFLLRDEIRIKQERLIRERSDWEAMTNAVRYLVALSGPGMASGNNSRRKLLAKHLAIGILRAGIAEGEEESKGDRQNRRRINSTWREDFPHVDLDRT